MKMGLKTWLFAIAVLVGSGHASATPLDGFDGYKFGMTKDEAVSLDRRRTLDEKCTYPGSKSCIEYYRLIAGLIAKVPILFPDKTGKVGLIPVFIDNADQPADVSCKGMWGRAVEYMFDGYGTPDKQETNQLHWSLDTGMKINMTALYISEQSCSILIVFTK